MKTSAFSCSRASRVEDDDLGLDLREPVVRLLVGSPNFFSPPLILSVGAVGNTTAGDGDDAPCSASSFPSTCSRLLRLSAASLCNKTSISTISVPRHCWMSSTSDPGLVSSWTMCATFASSSMKRSNSSARLLADRSSSSSSMFLFRLEVADSKSLVKSPSNSAADNESGVEMIEPSVAETVSRSRSLCRRPSLSLSFLFLSSLSS